MNARDLMTDEVAWIHLRATIASATRLLASAPAGVLCLLVGRGDRVPFGIVTPAETSSSSPSRARVGACAHRATRSGRSRSGSS